MNEIEHSLRVEWDQEAGKVEIHGDAPGLQFLIERLELLVKADGHEHDHLFTPSWGGSELSENDATHTLVNHLKLYKWR